MLCQFQVDSRETATHTHVPMLPQTPVPCVLPITWAEFSVLYIGPCWLSVLNIGSVYVNPELHNYPFSTSVLTRITDSFSESVSQDNFWLEVRKYTTMRRLLQGQRGIVRRKEKDPGSRLPYFFYCNLTFILNGSRIDSQCCWEGNRQEGQGSPNGGKGLQVPDIFLSLKRQEEKRVICFSFSVQI